MNHLVLIEEDKCIGCAKCLAACPFDAIIGAAQQMHTVIAQECTGCGLCIPACPVDCIIEVKNAAPFYSKDKAKQRVLARKLRLTEEEKKSQENFSIEKQNYITAALERVRNRS